MQRRFYARFAAPADGPPDSPAGGPVRLRPRDLRERIHNRVVGGRHGRCRLAL